MYLGITPVISNWSPAGDEFSLLIENNPLTEFVELPEGHNALNYSNILCGALKGCLEMVSIMFISFHSFFHFFFFSPFCFYTWAWAITPLLSLALFDTRLQEWSTW